MNATRTIGSYGQASKINHNTYFFYGGYQNFVHGEAFLLNTRERKLELLQSGPIRYTGASAFKDDKVYIFGGSSAKFQEMNECHAYDLKLNEWESISSLPVACDSMTAALVGKVIILSGKKLSCCYSYNDSVYVKVLNLPSGSNKVVCEGWILCNSVLYENKNENLNNWVSHNINNTWDKDLLVYTTFKKGQHFYFIDGGAALMRIDTERKKLEYLQFN